MTGRTPQPGDIGLVKVHGTEGRLIRFGQWLNGNGFEDVEHAFVHLGGGQLVEAEPGGARISALGEYAPGAVVWLRCPPQYGPAVAAVARSLEGVPYSFADYAALAAHRLRLPLPGLRGFVSSSHHVICSQLCDLAAQRGGWHLFADGRWPGYVTPGALYKLAIAQEEEGS